MMYRHSAVHSKTQSDLSVWKLLMQYVFCLPYLTISVICDTCIVYFIILLTMSDMSRVVIYIWMVVSSVSLHSMPACVHFVLGHWHGKQTKMHMVLVQPPTFSWAAVVPPNPTNLSNILNAGLLVADFYEEVLSLIYSLTSGQVSNHMWEVFPMIYQMFKKDGIDYFTGKLRWWWRVRVCLIKEEWHCWSWQKGIKLCKRPAPWRRGQYCRMWVGMVAYQMSDVDLGWQGQTWLGVGMLRPVARDQSPWGWRMW